MKILEIELRNIRPFAFYHARGWQKRPQQIAPNSYPNPGTI